MTTRSTRAGVIPTATISPGRTAPELLAFTPQGVVRTPFAPGAAVVIGRSSTSDLVVDAPSVSRQHARFECGAVSYTHLDVYKRQLLAMLDNGDSRPASSFATIAK